MKQATAKEAAESVVRTLHEAGHIALLAGGCVRDLLLNNEPKDYDVVTDALPERVVKLFRRTNEVGAKFGVVLVYLRGCQIEVATFRADGSYTDGRHPDAVTYGSEIEDAKRRDFTINGMFLDITDGRVIDHVGGRDDLRSRLIRAIGDPDRRFAEDHLRMLRAVRFAARLGFEIEPVTLNSIRGAAALLDGISRERVREELRMILTHPSRERGWRLVHSTGLVNHLMSDVRFDLSVAEAVGRRLAAIGSEVSFPAALAAMLAHLSPTTAEQACRMFSCSNVELRSVGWLLTLLPRVWEVEKLELADVKLLLADSRFADLCALLRADLIAGEQSLDPYDKLFERSRSIPVEEVAPPPLVTGEDLLSRSVAQGPVYARVLSALYRAQLNMEITDRSQALTRLDEMLARE